MRIFVVLLGFAVFSSTGALGEDNCRCWTPSIEDIAGLEARIKDRPTPLGDIDLYVRHYGGVIGSRNGRRYIQGKLIPPTGIDAPGIQIEQGALPPLQGEGCASNSDADGRWLFFICARPGAWTPSDAQIAELENVLARTAVRGTSEWTAYARHYAGVLRGDRRIVEGVFETLPGMNEKPGIYVESEAELPMVYDGGCSVVSVTYDPSTKVLTARCNGR